MASYLPIIMFFVILYLTRQRRRRAACAARLMKKRGNAVAVAEIMERYGGKRCLIYTLNVGEAAVVGTVIDARGKWIVLKPEIPTGCEQTELINGAYITRIKEYPDKCRKKAVSE